MSFAFGFTGDDISNGDGDEDKLMLEAPPSQARDPQDQFVYPPTRHSLEDLYSAIPSRLSYNRLVIAPQNPSPTNNGVSVPRRSMFDIRTQLMAEAHPEDNNNDSLLAGLENGDLSSGIYEGGFKTWECSVDLASLLLDLEVESQHDLHVIELGAGSAIPSIVLLQQELVMSSRITVTTDSVSTTPVQAKRHVHFTLCDYNQDVLKLVTAPNILLCQSLSPNPSDQRPPSTTDNDTIGNIADRFHPNHQDQDLDDITPETLSESLSSFDQKSITFDLISGSWGPECATLIQPAGPDPGSRTLILASETIYSPPATRLFVSMLMQLLRRDPTRSRAWVAAKKVYFGVGGGVDDFVELVERVGGSVAVVLDVKGAGVGRVVLEVVAT